MVTVTDPPVVYVHTTPVTTPVVGNLTTLQLKTCVLVSDTTTRI